MIEKEMGESKQNNLGISSPPSCISRYSHVFISNFEKFFFNWGIVVAKNPWTFIVSSIAITLTMSIGLLNFTAENRPTKLWMYVYCIK